MVPAVKSLPNAAVTTGLVLCAALAVSTIPFVFTDFFCHFNKVNKIPASYMASCSGISPAKHTIQETSAKRLLPLAIQVHHAVCDGYHVGLFVDKLQKYTHGFETYDN